MDLSTDIGNLHKEQIKAESSSVGDEFGSMQDIGEILDLSGLDLDNEETWLYQPLQQCETKQVRDWLQENVEEPSFNPRPANDLFSVPKLKSSKNIDTRTFTRPKKKYARPSINDIEQMYHSGSDGSEMNSSTEYSPRSKFPQTVQEEQETPVSEPSKPLQFDLSQPTSLHNFDSLLLNNSGLDSFQNMSPPSLVNSLCSSTFQNLMESSFIKNDPVLREIRDKDFTETALLQDMDAPLFQSITESCSSLNSDTPENFLKKVSRDNTFRRISGDKNVTTTCERICEGTQRNSTEANATFDVENTSVTSNTSDAKDATFSMEDTLSEQPKAESPSTKHFNSPGNVTIGNMNGTYRRTPKHNGTFRKSDLRNNRLSLNFTYDTPRNITPVLNRDVSRSIENDMNNSNKTSSEDLNSTRTKSSGKTVILRNDSIEDLKRKCSSSEGSVDLNRLSYCEEEKQEMNQTYGEEKISSELNRTVEIKRSSLGSADSLDRMSSLSSSSKGSNKVLSMEDVEAIVEMQERSLSQVMSTPKTDIRSKHLWENNFISPIVANAKETLSDSELSDDYKSVKSQSSSKVSVDNICKKPSAKSLGYLAVNKDVKMKRASYTLSGAQPLQALPNSIRGSYSNISTLKNTTAALGGSQQNLCKPPGQLVRPPSISNLKTMGTRLKGSYTSLRPISATLPVVPPVGSSLNSTHTVTRTASRTSTMNVTKTYSAVKTEVPHPPSKVVPAQHSGDSTFVKPQLPRASGLPRPTGIPRPASRIPAPRSSNIRPPSSRSVHY